MISLVPDNNVKIAMWMWISHKYLHTIAFIYELHTRIIYKYWVLPVAVA
jgi:hypothetical protein